MAHLDRQDDQRAELTGALVFDTVTPLIEEGRRLIDASGGSWCVDMSHVVRASSVGVAILLDWMRYSEAHNVTFQIEAMPSFLMPIIHVSDLDGLFLPFLKDTSA